MVLPKKLVPPVQEFYPLKVDAKTPKDEVCKETTQHAMAGLLTQLDFLAEYATSLFSGLVNEANQTAAQLKNLTARANELQAYLPQLEEMYQSTSLDVFHTYEKATYASANPQQHQHLTSDSFPDALRSVYDAECQEPPKLDVFDEYFPEGKKALQLYTNPEFFIEQWIEEQMKLQAEAKKARKAKRAQRKKQKKPETVMMKKKPTKLERVRYDPVTGEKITAKIAASEKKEKAKPTQRINVAVQSVAVPDEPVVEQHRRVPTIAVDSAPSSQPSSASGSVEPSPRDGDARGRSRDKKEKKSRKHRHNDAPAVPSSSAPPLPHSAPPVPSSHAPPLPRSRSPSPSRRAPAVPSQPSPHAPSHPPPSAAAVSAVATPPPAPAATIAAPPPMPPTAPSGIAAPPPPMPKTKLSAAAPKPSGGLLGQIAAGKTLKKVEPQERPKAQGGHSALLAQIQNGAALKRAADRKLAEKKVDDGPLSVADILARRIAIVGDDRDDDSSDSGDDWDDDDWD